MRQLSNDPTAFNQYNAALESLSYTSDEVTQSPYDIAAVSLVPGPQQRVCVEWLVNNQHSDGTWSTPFCLSWHDHYICTYAGAIALRNYGLTDKAERALATLPSIRKRYSIDTPETLTFGGLIVVLDRFAQTQGWWPIVQHDPLVQRIVDEEQDKWTRMLNWPDFYDANLSIAGYCGERVYGQPGVDLNRFLGNFQASNNSIARTPAASALCYLEILRTNSTVSADRLERLRSYLYSLNPHKSPIQVIDHFMYFVMGWSLMYISELGIPFDADKYPFVSLRLKAILSAVTGSHGLRLITAAGLAKFPGDPDTTSCAIAALDYTGHQVSHLTDLDVFYSADGGYYQTFLFERDPSLSTNIHISQVLAMTNSPHLESVLQWLQHEIKEEGNIVCKWHLSPFYTMGEVARVAKRIRHPLAQTLAIDAAEYLLARQRPDGGWGLGNSTIEETGYTVLGLTAVFDKIYERRQQDVFLDRLYRALMRGKAFLDAFETPLWITQTSSYPPLWVGKSNYCLKPLVRVLKAVSTGRIMQVAQLYVEASDNVEAKSSKFA
jgi:hypothetical protein